MTTDGRRPDVCETSQHLFFISLVFICAIFFSFFEKGDKEKGFYGEMLKGWAYCIGYIIC